MKSTLSITVLLIVSVLAPGSYGEADRPAKTPKKHVEIISSGEHRYQINLGGTLDEFNTACYPETYHGYTRLESKFQPNVQLTIANIGDTDVVNPRIVVNGRRNWFSADDIIAGVVKPGMSDAEKVMAIYSLLASYEVQCHENDRRVGPETPGDESHPARSTFPERANPVKALNCYYCGGCQFEAANLVILARHAGFAARPIWLNKLDRYGAHCLAEIWYDGQWHLFDPDTRTFFLDSDNITVASFQTLHRNPSLVDRALAGGFASPGLKARGSQYANIWPGHVMAVENWLSTMAMTLRPGEKFVYNWNHIGKYRCGVNRRNIKPERPKGLLPYRLANGKIVYEPRLDNPELFYRGIISQCNATLLPGENGPSGIQAQLLGFAGFCIYKVASPYPIVGGKVAATFLRKTRADACRIYISVHDSDWKEVFSGTGTGQIDAGVRLDEFLNPLPTPAIYDYYLKFEVEADQSSADATITHIRIESDVQMAATSLPSLSVGTNEIVYRDQSTAGRKVRVTHGWRQSSQTSPPLPPTGSVSPANGSSITAKALDKLVWQPAKDSDGSIVDYHVQLSSRDDFLYPVSPNFDRIIGSSRPQWSVPQGWLAPGKTYYWRIRACDNWGTWSEWSRPWKFKITDRQR